MNTIIECTDKIGNAWLSLRSDDGAISVSLRAGWQVTVPVYVLDSVDFTSATAGGYITADRQIVEAEEVGYDDSLTGLDADEIQTAIDNLSARQGFSQIVVNITVLDTPYSVTTANTILCDASGGTVTVILPQSLNKSGTILNIKKIDSSSNLVVVDGHSLDTIDGILKQSLTRQWENLSIQCDGSNWFIL